MGWILGLGNGVVFRTGSSRAWSSYWVNRHPTNLTLTLIAGGVKLDWDDNSDGAVQFEIWGKNDSDEYVYVDTVNAGITTYSNICDPVDLRYYKIRGLKSGHYSEFTEEQSIAMLSAELVGDYNLQSYWNFVFDTGWTADGSVLSCDGTSGYIRRSSFFTLGATYRTILTITGTGRLTDIYDGNYPQLRDAPGTFINNNYSPYGTRLTLNSVSFNGTITTMSVKQVLSPL